MSQIDIRRKHSRPLKDARAANEPVAQRVAEECAVACGSRGTRKDYSRGGVDGHIAVSGKEIHVTATLGFLLGAIKGPIEREIQRYLDEEFG